jgi:acetyl-CoA carboxylase biotin carboxyl carrier protein
MEIQKIEELIKLMRNYGLSELALETQKEKIKLVSNQNQNLSYHQPHSYPQSPGHGGSMVSMMTGHSASGHSAGSPSEVTTQVEKKQSGKVIRSPFVGTFYRASSPDSEPFATVGQRVKKGDSLCIIEAMKLMNEIEAEFAGVIKEILVENEEPVEYDQALFVIE